jgi:hypothetical protein
VSRTKTSSRVAVRCTLSPAGIDALLVILNGAVGRALPAR